MVNKKIRSIGVVLCCTILVQFILIICLANKKPEVIIEEVEIIKEVEVIKEVPVEVEIEVEPLYMYNIPSAEREMLARLVYREANGESIECQMAVVSVVINRWLSGYWGDTFKDVIYAPGQFSTAKLLKRTTPNDINYEAVDYVLKNGVTLPEYVLYFKATEHHKWKGYCGYTVIDKTYFGYMEKDKK